MMNLNRLLLLTAAVASALTLLPSCAESRYHALEERQGRYDSRHNARADRRELRSEHADARYSRSFDHW